MTSPAPPADWLVGAELVPSTEGRLAPLYLAAADGVLAMPFCQACGQPLELEQLQCHVCGEGGPRWETVEPSGTVHAVTTVHRLQRPLVRTTDAYHVVDVELRSGHRLVMATQTALSTAPMIGDPVRVAFRCVGGVHLPAVATTEPTGATDTEVSP